MIYNANRIAWNEFDEGGWICSTLFNGTDRLDAIREHLAKVGEYCRLKPTLFVHLRKV
jgi:hypothetical protein